MSDIRNDGIHMHACPLCGRGWDCSNECGVENGSLTKMTCGLCVRHVVGQRPPPHVPPTNPKSLGLQAAPVQVATREGIMHTHRCMIDNHLWEHDDPDCAMEEVIDLECPACFIFTSACPQCGHDAVEEVLLARSNKERAFWCQPCNFVFRREIKYAE